MHITGLFFSFFDMIGGSRFNSAEFIISKMSRSRSYCFTLHDYSEAEYAAFLDLFEDGGSSAARYVIVGKEVCPTTNALHLQGYVSFFNAKTLSALKKINNRAHWEAAKGSPEQNKTYCSKEGNFEERGDLPQSQKEKGQAEKDRWTDVIRLSREGDWDALAEKYPDVYATRLKTCEYIHKRRKLDIGTLDELEHVWIVGKTGCGKSRYAREKYPEAYIKDPNTRWWCDYDGQEAVIIDDFDKFQVKQGGDMKRWLDRYPFQAEVKGGMELIFAPRSSSLLPSIILMRSGMMRRLLMPSCVVLLCLMLIMCLMRICLALAADCSAQTM